MRALEWLAKLLNLLDMSALRASFASRWFSTLVLSAAAL